MNNVKRIIHSRTATGTATHAAATATAATPGTNQSVYLTGYSASFSAAPTAFATLQIKDGSTVLETIYVGSTPVTREFSSPIKIASTDVLTAVLGDGGTSIVGFVNIEYYIA